MHICGGYFWKKKEKKGEIREDNRGVWDQDTAAAFVYVVELIYSVTYSFPN